MTKDEFTLCCETMRGLLQAPELTGNAAMISEAPFLIGQVDGDWKLCRPGGLEALSLGQLVDQLLTAEDLGRSTLLEFWPDCPKSTQDLILGIVGTVGPMLANMSGGQ